MIGRSVSIHCPEPARSVEGRVDLVGVEARCIAFEMGAFGRESLLLGSGDAPCSCPDHGGQGEPDPRDPIQSVPLMRQRFTSSAASPTIQRDAPLSVRHSSHVIGTATGARSWARAL